MQNHGLQWFNPTWWGAAQNRKVQRFNPAYAGSNAINASTWGSSGGRA